MKHNIQNGWSWSKTFYDGFDVLDALRVVVSCDGSDGSVRYRCSTDDSSMLVAFELPGVKPEHVKLEASAGKIALSWQRGDQKGRAAFKVDDAYDAPAATARLQHGVLDVRVPRTPVSSKTVKIEVA